MRAVYKKIFLLPSQSFTCVEWRAPFCTGALSFQQEYTIMAMHEAKGLVCVGGSIETFQDGDLFLFGSNVPHYFVRDANDLRPMQHYISATFDENFLGETFFQIPEADGIRRMLTRSGRGIAFSRATFDQVFPDLLRAARADGWERLCFFLGVLGQLAAAPDSRPVASTDVSSQLDLHDYERLSAVCEYVHTHYNEAIREKDVAAVAGLSPVPFSRYFRRRLGMPFTYFLNQVRISEACRRLIEQDSTVLEIALQTGFNHLSHFNRRFLKHKGMTPRVYRKLHAENLSKGEYSAPKR